MVVFLYSFTRYAGHDRVFVCDGDGASAGDLLMIGKEYYLVLGEDVAWKEQYKYKLTTNDLKLFIQKKGLLSKKTMILFHRFVNERYTNYKNSVPLFLGNIEEIVKRQKSTIRKKSKKNIKSATNVLKRDGLPYLYEGYEISIKKLLLEQNISGQQLIVFPDIWTMTNSSLSLTSLDKKEYSILHGKSTKKQRAEAFWGIKNGTTKILFCTYSQLFQDWQNLERIILVDSHKRRYKNQKDPRYYVPTVLKQMKKVYQCEIINVGYVLK